MFLERCHTRAGAVSTAQVKRPVRAALGLASLFALCSFLIAVFSLVAYRLALVDIIQPLPDGPALHPVAVLSVILLAVCVVLTMQRARLVVDGVCAVVLLGALAQLVYPDDSQPLASGTQSVSCGAGDRRLDEHRALSADAGRLTAVAPVP